MVESNSEVVIDPGGEKFCQILLGSLYEGNKNWDVKVEQKKFIENWISLFLIYKFIILILQSVFLRILLK